MDHSNRSFIRYLFCFFLMASLSSHAQDFSPYIKQNAVRIDRLDSLTQSVYQSLASYQLIMIGEMHGTNEPARLVTGLVQLFTLRGDSVQVGLEIPPGKMKEYLNARSEESIYSSLFFAEAPIDGRASQAWAQVISTMAKNTKAKIFFYDVNEDDLKKTDNRDSVMYLKIKDQIKEHPGWRTITLSGNIHNMLIPYKGETKTGLYLKQDKELAIADKTCCLNHYYQRGSMLNNMGRGLELSEVNNPPSAVSASVDFENYLLLYPAGTIDRYSGFFFTKNITAAKMTGNPSAGSK